MPGVQCLKIRLEDGATERVVEFIEEIRHREEEVQASLAREGIRAEALFLERGDPADYLIFITWAEDLEAASRVFRESTAPLDRDTREWIDATWAEVRPLELLARFERGPDDRP